MNWDEFKHKLYCHKSSGGVYRLNNTLMELDKNVVVCSVAKDEDKKKCKTTINEEKIREERSKNSKKSQGRGPNSTQ